MSSENNTSSSEGGESADVPSTSTALTRRRASEEKLPSVAQNLARLRECEDYNMALALQEQEFSQHYNLNRTERKTVSGDLQKSLEEQKLALDEYLLEAAETARRDEELARNIQRELEEEDRRIRLNQAQLDEELARRLQMEEEIPAASPNVDTLDEMSTSTSMIVDPPTPNNTPASSVDRSSAPPTMANGDEEMAARLQERYLQRFAQKPGRSLDENTQNEFNVLMATSLRAKLPAVAPLPPPPSYSDCMRGAGLEVDTAGSSKSMAEILKKSNVSSKKDERRKSSEKRPTHLLDKENFSKNVSQSSGENLMTSSRKSTERGTIPATISTFESNCAMANSMLFDSPTGGHGLENECGARTMARHGVDTMRANNESIMEADTDETEEK